jgi:hypothetical protein
MAIKYAKWPENWPNGHKIYQHIPLIDTTNFTQIWILGLKINHLVNRAFNVWRFSNDALFRFWPFSKEGNLFLLLMNMWWRLLPPSARSCLFCLVWGWVAARPKTVFNLVPRAELWPPGSPGGEVGPWRWSWPLVVKLAPSGEVGP